MMIIKTVLGCVQPSIGRSLLAMCHPVWIRSEDVIEQHANHPEIDVHPPNIAS